MLIITLFFPLFFQLGNTCGSTDDSAIKQKIFFRGQCKCKEYVDVYATCYYFLCDTFPKFFSTSLKCFKITDSGIKELLSGDFDNLLHITELDIENNMKLASIQIGTLKDLNKLEILSISYNPSLMSLDQDVFEGLNNLVTLRLIHNGFNEIKDASMALKASFMPKLTTIILSELDCRRVEKDDFANLNGSGVRNIFFDNSQIDYIHPEAFIYLNNLKNLSVSVTLVEETNMIDVLKKISEHNIPLMSLNLKGWGFKMRVPNKLFNVIANTTITELNLNRNQFHKIDENTFPEMPNIESLKLEECVITDIKENAFIYFKNLKELYLKRNKMITVPRGVLIPRLEVLDISGNTIPGSSYFTIDDYTTKLDNMTSLKILDLSCNNIKRIYNLNLYGPRNLKKLNLFDANIMIISDNSFSELTNLEYLNLGKNYFPKRSWVKEIFTGLINLKYLSLESCKIEYFLSNDIFGELISLETLNLRNNFFTEITPDFMFSLRTLKVLDLSENRLKPWHNRLFNNNKTSMENLTISRNPFTYLTEAMLEDFFNFKFVDVSNNPFFCECDQLIDPFTSLPLSKINRVLNLLNQTSTFCLLPESAENTTIVEYYQNNYKSCQKEKEIKITNYLVPSLICGILFLLTLILCYIYRWHIRYWIFLTKLSITQRTQFNKKRDDTIHSNYLYDAFVSYSTEDRNFVITLVSMLENYEPFLKLCVYERDFELGTIISESVLECLSRSRKTLLIISNSYIKSQWCTWEAQVAENHRLFFENERGECVNDSLIMIKLGNISSSNISPMLKYLMKTRIYLQWDSTENKQTQFWEKLRNALGPGLNCENTT
ncbi:toll-like receptor 2 type-2 [Onthophagus taurus]|uniref:toll-like receptor 2 type-2 n=1 Tax=Onthophagus taurus TaxID=166361 RepID=UPI0039BDCED4